VLVKVQVKGRSLILGARTSRPHRAEAVTSSIPVNKTLAKGFVRAFALSADGTSAFPGFTGSLLSN
jgi:hypothetical protein